MGSSSVYARRTGSRNPRETYWPPILGGPALLRAPVGAAVREREIRARRLAGPSPATSNVGAATAPSLCSPASVTSLTACPRSIVSQIEAHPAGALGSPFDSVRVSYRHAAASNISLRPLSKVTTTAPILFLC